MASHLFEAGVSLCWLKKFLGHASLQTTLVYLHLTDDGEEVGRDQLNAVAQPGTLFEHHVQVAKEKAEKKAKKAEAKAKHGSKKKSSGKKRGKKAGKGQGKRKSN